MDEETVVIEDDSDVEVVEVKEPASPQLKAKVSGNIKHVTNDDGKDVKSTVLPSPPCKKLKADLKEPLQSRQTESDSDVEMIESEAEKVSEIASSSVTAAPKESENSEVTITRVNNEVFLDNYLEKLKLDAIEDKKITNSMRLSGCMRKNCTSGKEPKKAPHLLKELFCESELSVLLLCEECCLLGLSIYKDMIKNIGDGESFIDVEIPPIDECYLQLDPEEEKENSGIDEKPLLQSDIPVIAENLPSAITNVFESFDCGREAEKANDLVIAMEQECKGLQEEFWTHQREIESGVVKTIDDLYNVFAPTTTILECIDLDKIKGTDKIIAAMNPEARRRTRMIKRQIASGIVGPQRSIPGTVTEDAVPCWNDSQIVTETFPCDMSRPDFVKRLDWPPPKEGDRVYAMKISTYSEWVPAHVEQIKTKIMDSDIKVTSYKVTVYGRQVYQKNVALGALAYWPPPPRETILTIGARVIAPGMLKKKVPQKFFAGMVAEVPCKANKERYLIFFEDGFTEYIDPENIRLVCEFRDDIATYFDKKSEAFIKNYLLKFPKRRMMKFDQTTDTVRTENKGEWQMAKVAEVDGALVKVTFEKTQVSEWIYRGSTRLYPVFEETLRYLEGGSRNRHQRARRIVHENPSPSNRSSSGVCSVQQPPRAVARKSTAMFKSNEGLPYVPFKSPPVIDGSVKTITITPNITHCVPHVCLPSCVASSKYCYQKGMNVSLLVIPLKFGFVRANVEFYAYAENELKEEGSKESFRRIDGTLELGVIYFGPCGRPLRCIEEVHEYLRVTDSQFTVDMFDFDFWVRVCDEYVVDQKFIIIPDLSYGNENIPIPCVNSVDNTVPTYMDYRTERKGCDGVFLNLDQGFLTCCDCTDDCSDKLKCSCWQKTIQGFKALGRVNKTDPLSIGYQFRRLHEVVTTGIYECNERCKCKMTCFNRVVQNPLQQKLQLFKTRRKGWGTRCLNDIPAGSFICVYMGDILTEANANEDGRRYGDEYFAELDYIEVVEALKEDYEDQVVGGDIDDEINSDYGGDDFNFVSMDSDDEYDFHDLADLNQGPRMKLRERRTKRKEVPEEEPEENTPASRAREEEERNRLNVKANHDIRPSPIVKPQTDPQSLIDFQLSDIPTRRTRCYDENVEYKSVREYYGSGESVYIIDAKSAGNIGRYLNHSCDPNIFVQNVFVDTHDLRFPWVAFFALRHIKAGTELTWDYRYEVGSVPGKKLFCYCESSECRGRLL